MAEEVKERKCKKCGKKLLDEKLPICLRCRLKGRNKCGRVGEGAAGLALLMGSVKALNDHNNNNEV